MAKKKAVAKTAKPYTPPPQSAPGAFVDKFDQAKSFFKSVVQSFGPLRQMQVDGFNAILKAWSDSGLTDNRWLAYMLATTWHETAATMQPIAEYGKGKGRAYGRPDKRTGLTYYGRGYVQLTHFENYKKYGIEKTPERALEPAMAAHILIDGMQNGAFTGKKLSDYFNAKKDDPVNARKIINGTDRAKMVAGHYAHFVEALSTPVEQKIS